MSQRTRGHTTGAATRKPRSKAAEPTPTTSGKAARSVEAPDERPSTSPADGAASAISNGEAQLTPIGVLHAAPDNALAPETLARTLRAVAAELERDPDLARRVAQAIATSEEQLHASSSSIESHAPEAALPPAAETPKDAPPRTRAFRPRLITGASPDLGPGVPDPFTLYQQRGVAGLRAVLEELRLGSLRAIVREHKLDPSSKLVRQNDADKLREMILAAVTDV